MPSASRPFTPPPQYAHLGVYAFRLDDLLKYPRLPESSWAASERLEQLRWLDAGYHFPVWYWHQHAPSVNTPADLERVRGVLLTSAAQECKIRE